MKGKNILKWFILTIIFLIILISFIKITTYIMKPLNVDLKNIAGLYGEKENSLDMVYIGGSASFVYWEPLRAFEKEGIASYDYGSNTIQVELYKTMIKEVLKTQQPKLIVIDARAFQYREEDHKPTEVNYRAALTGMPMSLNKIEFISNNVKKYLGQDELSYYFDIIKYHRDISKEEINEQIAMAFNQYKNPYKGFHFISKVYKIESEYVKTEKRTPVAAETEVILKDLLEYIKTTNCNYLFVVSPYRERESEKELLNYVSDIVNQYGYAFIDANDYNDQIQIDFDRDLYNDAHVNIFGADKYTDFLMNYIKANYDLPNRKEDEDYQSWNELLQNWNEEVNDTKAKTTEKIKERK